MNDKQIISIPIPADQRQKLEAELAAAREKLVVAEADLAREQAAVNAFRMHARLKLDALVDELETLRERRQSCLTRLQLLRQTLPDLAEEDFWPETEPLPDDGAGATEDEDLLLPTPTPHDKAAEKRLYRELARRFHPDLAETAVERAYRTSVMASVNNAYAAGNTQALYDLAGELDPAEMAELAGIENMALRRLREQLLKIRQRRRKVRRQLQTLRQENTARLWRKAQELAEEGIDWWAPVRRELETAVSRRQAELERLEAALAHLEQAAVAAEEVGGAGSATAES